MAQTTDALFINAAGNVGIGAPTPETKLHVAGTGGVEISLQSTSAGGRRFTLQSGPRGGAITALFQIIDRTANVCRMGIDSVGNVGINTSTPGKTLDVNGDIRANKTITGQSFKGETIDVSGNITSEKTITGQILKGETFDAGSITATKTIAAKTLRADGTTLLLANGSNESSNNVVLYKNSDDAYMFPFGTGTKSNMLVVGGGLATKNTGFIVTGNTQLRGEVSVDKQATFYDLIEIKGNRQIVPPRFRYFNSGTFNGDGYLGSNPTSTWAISLKAQNIVLASEFFAFSDVRIKKDLQLSDASKDLAVLKRLEVTEYKYIDALNYGKQSKKGFIAQQVEGVFAEAVHKRSDFIPDIFAVPEHLIAANSQVIFTMTKPHQLANGDAVKIYTKTGEHEAIVTLVSANSFSIAGSLPDYAEAFVFGKKVDDFRVVDYDRLFTLNVSATQELSRKIEKLEGENEKMESENEKMKTAYDQLSEKINRLEAMITDSKKSSTPAPALTVSK